MRNSPSVGSPIGTNGVTLSGGKRSTGARELQAWDSWDTGAPPFIALHGVALHGRCAFLPADFASLPGAGLHPHLQPLQGGPGLSLHECRRVSTASRFSDRSVLTHGSSLPFPGSTHPTSLNFPCLSDQHPALESCSHICGSNSNTQLTSTAGQKPYNHDDRSSASHTALWDFDSNLAMIHFILFFLSSSYCSFKYPSIDLVSHFQEEPPLLMQWAQCPPSMIENAMK